MGRPPFEDEYVLEAPNGAGAGLSTPESYMKRAGSYAGSAERDEGGSADAVGCPPAPSLMVAQDAVVGLALRGAGLFLPSSEARGGGNFGLRADALANEGEADGGAEGEPPSFTSTSATVDDGPDPFSAADLAAAASRASRSRSVSGSPLPSLPLARTAVGVLTETVTDDAVDGADSSAFDLVGDGSELV